MHEGSSVCSYFRKNHLQFPHAVTFFLSGIFVERSLSRGISRFFWDKVKVLLYPYFLWSLIHGGIQIILSPYTNDKLTELDLLQVIFIPIAHFWFLQALFFSFLIYGFIKRSLPTYMLLLIALVMYAGKFFLDPGPINNVSRMFLFFVMGSIFAYISQKVQIDIDGGRLIIIGVFFFAFQVAVFHFGFVDLFLVKFLAVLVGICFVISLSTYFQGSIISGFIGQLGFLSMPIGYRSFRTTLRREGRLFF